MPTCICQECRDARNTKLSATLAHTNTTIQVKYDQLLRLGTVVKVNGRTFFYYNSNHRGPMEGVWMAASGSNVYAEDFLPDHLQGNKIEIVYSRVLHNYEENEE